MSKVVLVSGDRNWTDGGMVYRMLQLLEPTLVIHGAARGADTLAEDAARRLQIEYRGYPAQWDRHGRSAGPIRNRRMLDDNEIDVVLFFHRDLESSKGTKDMVNEAGRRDLTVIDGFKYATQPAR